MRTHIANSLSVGVLLSLGALLPLGALSACTASQRPAPAAVIVTPAAASPTAAGAPVAAAAATLPAEPDPFDDTPESFTVSGPHFSPGEVAMIRVCASSDGTIVSAEVAQSSGDKRFDDFALVWARQVRLRSTVRGDSAKQACGPVRVEIRSPQSPQIFSGPGSLLG